MTKRGNRVQIATMKSASKDRAGGRDGRWRVSDSLTGGPAPGNRAVERCVTTRSSTGAGGAGGVIPVATLKNQTYSHHQKIL